MTENYKKLITRIEGCKKDMMEHGGYDEIVIDDFYDTFLDNLKKLATLKDDYAAQSEIKSYPEYVHWHLMKVLANHDVANYIIMFMRFCAATYLKQNAIMYEDFLGEPVATFCTREVEQVDVECDHP